MFSYQNIGNKCWLGLKEMNDGISHVPDSLYCFAVLYLVELHLR